MIIYDPIITGSFQINGRTISSVGEIDNLSGSVAALNNASSSYLLNTTDTLTGNLTVTGTLTAQEFHTEYTSASIVYQSGSTKFGDSADDVHEFTGNVGINTNSPVTALHTVGKIRAAKLANTSAYIQLSADELTSNYAANILLNDTGLTFKHNSNSRGFVFDRNGSTLMTLSSSGHLTLSGGNLFLDSGTSYNDKGIIYLSNQRTAIISDIVNLTANGDTSLDFQTRSGGNLASSMFIDEFRRVGIGTNAPQVRLDYGNDTGQAFHLYSSGDDYYGFNMAQYDSGTFSTTIFSGNNGTIKFRTAAGTTTQSTRMTITADGKVGIGTTAPASILHIGDGTASDYIRIDSLNGGAIQFRKGTTSSAFIGEVQQGLGSGDGLLLYTYSGGDRPIRFYPGGSERVRITNEGDIGVGVTSPEGKLHVYQPSGAGPILLTRGADKTGVNLQLSVDSSKVRINGYGEGLTFFTAPAGSGTNANEKMRIDSSGRVGIGTTPQTWGGFTPLQVRDASFASTGGDLNLMNNIYYDGTNYKYIASQAGARIYFNTDGTVTFHNAASGTAGDNVTWNERLRITSAGGVGIGTDSVVGKFTVSNGAAGNSTASGASVVNNAGTGVNIFPSLNTGNYNTLISSGDSFIAGNGQYSPIAIGSHDGSSIRVSRYDIKFATNNALKATLNSDGNLGLGTTAPGAKLHVNGSQILNGDLTIPYSTAAVTNTIGIETSPTNPFSLTAKSLVIQGANAYQAGTPTQAQAGGDVFIKGGYGIVNTGLGAYAGDVSIEGGVTHDSGAPGAGSVIFKTTNTERLRIDNNGTIQLPYAFVTGGLNQGAGVITDPGTYTGMRLYGQGDGNLKIFNVRNNSAYGNIIFYTGNGSSEALRIAQNGNVGVGTTSPSQKLHLVGNSYTTGYAQAANAVMKTYTSGGTGYAMFGSNSAVVPIAIGRDSSYLDVVLDTAGNLGINRTSPLYKLHVEGDAGVNSLILSNSSTSTFGTMVKTYQDYIKRSFVLNYSFTFTGAGTYYFNLAFPTSGGFGWNLRLVTGRSGNWRNFGYIDYQGYAYWEPDGDFRHEAQSVDIASSYGGGITVGNATGFGANNLTDTSEGTTNYSYYIVRIPITFPDNTTGSDGYFKVHLDTFGYGGDTAYFLNA